MSLRILHVTPYFTGAWAYGGIPRLASALVRGLAERGHRVTVCTTDAHSRQQRLAPGPPLTGSVDVHVFRNRSNRLAYDAQLFTPVGLRRYLAGSRGRFDIAHIHGHRHLLEVMAARWCRRSGIPYVSAPNGTAPRIERRRRLKRAWDLLWGGTDLAGAAAIVAVTEAERRQLVAHGVDAGRIRVVPNPVDLDEFEPRPSGTRWRERLSPDGRLVVFLGKLTPRKRLDVVIAAAARLPRAGLRLVIAGNDMGAGAAARAQVRASGLEEQTTFTDLLSGRERLELLAAADVVVYPSEAEVFGLVPLEALLCGTPVVVAGDSGCGEVVAALPGGQVVPIGDAHSLAQAVGRVLALPAPWRQRAIEGGRLARRLYAAPVVAERIDALYREVLAR
jgi:glycosyltransferase involved in cell wall biosynthesis